MGQQSRGRRGEGILGRWNGSDWRLTPKPWVFCFYVSTAPPFPMTIDTLECREGKRLRTGPPGGLKNSCSRWQNPVHHCKKSHFFPLCFWCWSSHSGPGTSRQARALLQGCSPALVCFQMDLYPVAFIVRLGGRKREFPSVCPQGTLTAVTRICQDTCPGEVPTCCATPTASFELS